MLVIAGGLDLVIARQSAVEAIGIKIQNPVLIAAHKDVRTDRRDAGLSAVYALPSMTERTLNLL